MLHDMTKTIDSFCVKYLIFTQLYKQKSNSVPSQLIQQHPYARI